MELRIMYLFKYVFHMCGCDSMFSENTSDQIYKSQKACQCPIFLNDAILANFASIILYCGDSRNCQVKNVQ